MTPQIHTEILERLAGARKRKNVAALVEGLTVFALLALILLLVVLGVEGAFRLTVLPRTLLFWFSMLFIAAVCTWYIVRPLLRMLGILKDEPDGETAARVGRRFPHINDHLVNILQLFNDREHAGRLYSSALIDASFEDVYKEIQPLDFTSIVDTSTSRRLGKLLASMVAVTIVLVALFPSNFFDSAQRLLNYSQEYSAPLPFRFIVIPGNAELVKGESVAVTVRVEGEAQRSIKLLSRPEGQVAYEEQSLEPLADGSFKSNFASLRASTSYYVRSGDVQSDEFTLKVVDRPLVKSLQLRVSFPSYARLAARELEENIGDVSALKGTKIGFTVKSNKPLAEARLVFSDKREKVLDVNGDEATGMIPLLSDKSYHLLLKDKEGLANGEPIEYSLKVVPDAYPTAAIIVPGTNLDIAENSRLNMLFKITDDYGFSSLRLAYKLIQSRYEKPAEQFSFFTVPLEHGVTTEAEIPYLWNLGSLSLVPEDVISYYVEVFDNDNISGPKSARSETYTLRLPSMEEVFADVDKSHDVSLDGMKEALQQAQEARKDLEELQQDLKKNQQKMDWQQQKKAEELGRKYQDVQKKLDEVNKTVENMVAEMQKNQVLSKETMEKYQELQQLMEQMNSPEFTEAMKKLQQSMQQMNPEQMKQALQEFKFSEENFRESIERTMNLLKRLQIEQKVDEMVKRTEEIRQQQEDLQKQTEQTNPSDKNRLDDLARKQEDLKKQLEELQKEMAELQKKMEDFPTEMPLDEMAKAQEEMEQSQLEEQMEQIAQQMQQQQMQQAMQNQRSAMQKMGKMKQQMQQMQQAMRQNQQRQIVNEMRKAMQDLLELSKRQEALKNQAQSMDQSSQRFRENAQEQMDVMRDLSKVTDGLSQLSQRTFSISPDMGKSIGDAMRQMDQAMQSLEQRNGTTAGQQQSGAMASLNEAANQMQGAMNAMMQPGGSGMGMQGFMQQLQRMSGQQQGINQGTRNLGGMTPQQAAEMGRLAGEQGMVRKSLEQLAKEAAQTGELSKMLGDLNRAAQEMREVQTDLAQGNVNPETLRKQDRILSRLLDSQRSARERDFEKKRQAESGKNLLRLSPREIDLTNQEGRNRLRQDLLKAMEEGYAKDYQDLIRKYFEALEKAEGNN